MRKLEKYNDYDRKEVHDIFSPHTNFTPQAGTWGLQGIVKVPDTEDFIFFVTLGRQQGTHVFEEGITEHGILTWQSQPSQKLKDKTILTLINHDHNTSNIYLFFRTTQTNQYTFLGRLAYINHLLESECPVHFKWQILDWDITAEITNRIGLKLQEVDPTPSPLQKSLETLEKSEPPIFGNNTKGATTRVFQVKKINFADSERENKILGSAGEKLVFEYEKSHLSNNGRADLAERVLHVAEIIGDGLGYDVESYNLNGEKKYIEVKTTCGDERTPFILTKNELEFSRTHADSYSLYRIYDYNKTTHSGSFYIIEGFVQESFSLEPIKFKAYR